MPRVTISCFTPRRALIFYYVRGGSVERSLRSITARFGPCAAFEDREGAPVRRSSKWGVRGVRGASVVNAGDRATLQVLTQKNLGVRVPVYPFHYTGYATQNLQIFGIPANEQF
jgi:hypothetical protein